MSRLTRLARCCWGKLKRSFMLKILTHDSDKHLPHRPGPARARVVVRVKNSVDNKNTWNSQSHIQHHQGLLAYPGLGGRHTALAEGFLQSCWDPAIHVTLKYVTSHPAAVLRLQFRFAQRLLGSWKPASVRHVRPPQPPVASPGYSRQPVNFTPPSDPALSAVTKPVKASLNVSLSVLWKCHLTSFFKKKTKEVARLLRRIASVGVAADVTFLQTIKLHSVIFFCVLFATCFNVDVILLSEDGLLVQTSINKI